MEPTKTTKTPANLRPKLLATRLLSKLLLPFLFISTLVANSVSAGTQKVIAITQIVEHKSLAEAKRGIQDVLAENGYLIGPNLKIIDKCAQGNISNALLIAQQFVSIKPDVIIPISTASAQSVISAAKDTDIPIVFSSVTDPVAAGLVPDITRPVKNITGAMDFPLIDEEIKLIQILLPNIKTIGFLYNLGEANSVKTIILFKQAIQGKIKYIELTVTDSNQVGQAISGLIGKVDAIYIPSDNTIFSSLPKLVQMSRKYKLPVFSSDPDSVKQGVLACIGYTQYAVGRAAGGILLKVLSGERKIAIEKPSKAEIFINKKSADIMNIAIPEEIIGLKTKIVE